MGITTLNEIMRVAAGSKYSLFECTGRTCAFPESDFYVTDNLRIRELLMEAVNAGASDLHLTVGLPRW